MILYITLWIDLLNGLSYLICLNFAEIFLLVLFWRGVYWYRWICFSITQRCLLIFFNTSLILLSCWIRWLRLRLLQCLLNIYSTLLFLFLCLGSVILLLTLHLCRWLVFSTRARICCILDHWLVLRYFTFCCRVFALFLNSISDHFSVSRFDFLACCFCYVWWLLREFGHCRWCVYFWRKVFCRKDGMARLDGQGFPI